MGKGYNNYMTKKPFHPGSKANIKRTWMAEQRTENEKRKQEELKLQYEKEQDLYNNRALLSTESKDKLELNFMYEAPPGAKRERQKEDDEPEYKFEWQRKYNAPREDYAKGNADIRDQPFGIPVRNVRCIKCHKWGHVNTDKECPLFNSASASSMPTTSMDPLELMRQMREDGYDLKQNVLGHHLNPAQSNQQFVHSDESDPEMDFLKSLTPKQKKKLLKKLNKLSRKQKKKDEVKKKKKHRAEERAVDDSSDSDSDGKSAKKKKSKSRSKQDPGESVDSDLESDADSEENYSSKHRGPSKRHKKDKAGRKERNSPSPPPAETRVPSKTGRKKSGDGSQDGADGDGSSGTNKTKRDPQQGDDHDQSVDDAKRKTSSRESGGKGHDKKKRESKKRRHKDPDSGSSSEEDEDDARRGRKKKSPDVSVGDTRNKRKKEDRDGSKEGDSSPVKPRDDSSSGSGRASPKKRDGKKDVEEPRKSDLLSTGSRKDKKKKRRPDDEPGAAGSPDEEQKGVKRPSSRGVGERDRGSSSRKKPVKADRKPIDSQGPICIKEEVEEEECPARDEGAAAAATPASPRVKSEPAKDQVVGRGSSKDSPQTRGEVDVKPSTSKRSASTSSSEDEDDGDSGKFAKPPQKSVRSGDTKKKSPSTDRDSPEHPDGFSHKRPQKKHSDKEMPDDGGDDDPPPEEPKYIGNAHDRFRNLHRHRRSPSVKHKYRP